VPRLADWCVVQVLDGSLLVNVGLQHFDPAKLAWAEQMSGLYPVDMNAPTGAANVIRTGTTELYPDLPPEIVEASAVDEEHLQVLLELGLSSALVVPLIGRSGVLGAITLIYAESGRHYSDDDVPFAEDVARRAALALETATAIRDRTGRFADAGLAGGMLPPGEAGAVRLRSVVLVEDDPGDALLVTEMLRDVAADVELTHFPTVGAALAYWPAGADCALLDLGLPDAIGLTALERLRAQIPDVPVVVFTGRSDDAVGPDALAAGAQDFLVKGQVDGAGLERSLRYAVERGRATSYERDLVAADVRAQENTRLQRGLLPSPLLEPGPLEVASFYRPGSERALLGGDFYDVVQTGTGVHLLIGDVSGHGPDEAALGVALRITWRALVLAGLTPAEVLRGVEQVLLVERSDDERFATVAMVSLSPDLSRADIVLCGHPAPLLMRGDEVVPLELSALPVLTMLPRAPIESATVDLDGDWGLMLFTDGLVEGSQTPRAVDRFGVDGLVGHLQPLVARRMSRADLAPTVLAEAERRHGGPLTDDVAVLLVGSAGWWC
jgi:serine phosphatase RsbU (regulator of sigma subunit)